MAFYDKISVVFLLWIFLLSCSSHANDHLPEVRVGDRKVLGLRGYNDLYKDFTRGTGRSPMDTRNNPNNLHETSYGLPTDTTTRRSFDNSFGLKGLNHETSKSHEDTRFDPNRYGDHQKTMPSVDNSFSPRSGNSGSGLESESGPAQKLAEDAAAKLGEKIAFKLFGANGKKAFRIGWKLGKRIYKLDKKCRELEKNLNLTCDEQSTLANIPGMSCVLLFAHGSTSYRSTSCNDEVSGKPESIPCIYYEGTFYKYNPSDKRFYNVTLHGCAY